MYFVFVIKTRHKFVSRRNNKITRKEMSKLFSCDYLTIHRNVARCQRERYQEKDYGLYLCIIFNEHIKENIIMAVLRRANFHSVDICRLMKNKSCEKRSRRKSDSNFKTLIYSKLPSCTQGFKKKECSAYYRILFSLKNITKYTLAIYR